MLDSAERERMQLVYEIILLTTRPFRKFAIMLPLYISCTITEFCVTSSLALDNWGQNIVRLLAIAIFFDRFTFKFLKNHRLLSKINTVSLRFISLSFPSKKSSSERACPYWQWIVCTVKKRNDWYQWFVEKPFTPCASRTIIFQRENLKYLIVCFTQCTLFFQYVWFLLPCVICGTYVTRKMLGRDTSRSRHSSRVALLVYVRTYCVPIATIQLFIVCYCLAPVWQIPGFQLLVFVTHSPSVTAGSSLSLLLIAICALRRQKLFYTVIQL